MPTPFQISALEAARWSSLSDSAKLQLLRDLVLELADEAVDEHLAVNNELVGLKARVHVLEHDAGV